MKILISADFEGVSGVVHPDQIYPDGKGYKDALNRWHQELNAIVLGLREAGVKEIVINDSHNHMRNLDNSLIPNASVVLGWQRPYSMVYGVDQKFDACIFQGYHSMSGSCSTLSHTYRPGIIKQVLLNKLPVGETGLNAALAGYFNVPVIMVTGDEDICYEAQKLIGEQLVTVQTKKGLSRYSALSCPFDINLDNLKLGAIKAIKQKSKWEVYKLQKPYTLSVTFSEPNHADAAELIPDVKRSGPCEVTYTDKDYSVVFKCFLAMGALAKSRDEVIT